MKKAKLKKNGWSPEELGEQSSYEDTTEISRRLRRGDETAGDPNARDVAGAIPEEETPHGREKSKTGHMNQPGKNQTRNNRQKQASKV